MRTATDQLIEEIKQQRRDYQNAWRAAHKDRVKAYNQRYWARRAAAAMLQKEQQQAENERGVKAE